MAVAPISLAKPYAPSYALARRLGVAGAAALTSIFIGALVLLGWATDVPQLTSIRTRFIPMLPMTAVGMLAGGSAILLLRLGSGSRWLGLARLLGAFVALLGTLGLISRGAGRDLFGYSVLFFDRVSQYPYRPLGVMASNSGISFALAGISLVLISSANASARRVARGLAVIGAAIAAVALLGHAYDAPALFAVDRAAGMALITALGFASLQIGVLLLRPGDEGPSLLTADDMAARLTRRILPITIAFPVLAGMLWLQGREENWFSRETGMALFVALTVFWLIAVALYSAKLIRGADAARAALLEREQQARALAEHASKAKGDFLAVMSHELRTPLNAVVGYAELLSHETAGPVTDTQRRHLERIRDSARHLTRVVDDVLTLSRLDAEKIELSIAPVDVAVLLEEVRGVLSPLAQGKGLRFDCGVDGPLVVSTDAHRLRQILINLVGNAVKFTATGGVSVTARRDPVSGATRIEVRDTGIGIAPEHLERIFDEFWQAAHPLTRNQGGTGLGLPVSRRLARLLGGEIHVSSRLGEGSSFVVELPAVPGGGSRAAVESSG